MPHTIVLFIRYLFNKELKAEIKLKEYEGHRNDDPSVMQINSISKSESMVMAIQGQNEHVVNQGHASSAPRLNWKANPPCCKCGEKGHLARECPHAEKTAILRINPHQDANTPHLNAVGFILLPTTISSLSQTIIAEIPIFTETWQGVIDKLNKANQDSKLLSI